MRLLLPLLASRANAIELTKGNDESDEEGETLSHVELLESHLLAHDPTFALSSTHAASEARSHQLLNAFIRGVDTTPSRPSNTPSPALASASSSASIIPEEEARAAYYNPNDLEMASRLHLNVERVRVAEVLWQPQLAGLDLAGLGEVVGHVLGNFTVEERDRLTKVRFFLLLISSLRYRDKVTSCSKRYDES